MQVRLLAVAAAIGLGAATCGAGAHASPRAQVCSGLRATVVHFRAADDVRLYGALVGKGRVGIALAHEYNADLCNWAPYARYLAARGFRVLLFDMRCFGKSACRKSSHVDADVSGAAAELRRRGASRIVVAGASLGGSATLVAAASLARPPAAVVSLSAPGTGTLVGSLGHAFALDPDAAVRRLKAPTLFLAASSDEPFQNDARSLYAISSSRAKRLEIVAGPAHGTGMLDPVLNPAAKHARALIVAFIRAHT
jgi:pimeloyl-ACP methyl ester carboxylesterase